MLLIWDGIRKEMKMERGQYEWIDMSDDLLANVWYVIIYLPASFYLSIPGGFIYFF